MQCRFSLVRFRLTALAVLAGALVLLAGCQLTPTPPPASFDYLVKVRDSGGTTLPNAKVTIEVPGRTPLDEFADVNGLVVITIPATHANQTGKLIAEAAGFEIYRENITLRQASSPTRSGYRLRPTGLTPPSLILLLRPTLPHSPPLIPVLRPTRPHPPPRALQHRRLPQRPPRPILQPHCLSNRLSDLSKPRRGRWPITHATQAISPESMRLQQGWPIIRVEKSGIMRLSIKHNAASQAIVI